MPPRRTSLQALLAGLVLGLLLSACATPPMPSSVSSAPIDLSRFMGQWHVIARVPYFAERGDVASSDTYTLQPGGDIHVIYRYHKGFGLPQQTVESRATVQPGSDNRDWTTWFFGVLPTRFRILEVAPDYSWALVNYPGRELAWVFARQPVMDDALYAQLLQKLRRHGVDADLLLRVPQVPAQVGRPGYAAPEKMSAAAN